MIKIAHILFLFVSILSKLSNCVNKKYKISVAINMLIPLNFHLLFHFSYSFFSNSSFNCFFVFFLFILFHLIIPFFFHFTTLVII